MKFIHLSCIFLFAFTLSAQEHSLSEHRWKHRIILIDVTDQSDVYIEQKNILSSDKEGVDERKLVLCSAQEWKLDQKVKGILKEYKTVLIGLDGGVKMRSNKCFTLEELYTEIDKMPMRRWEIE